MDKDLKNPNTRVTSSSSSIEVDPPAYTLYLIICSKNNDVLDLMIKNRIDEEQCVYFLEEANTK